MNCQKCFGASICTTLQKCAAPRIDGEGFSRSFLRQKVTKQQWPQGVGSAGRRGVQRNNENASHQSPPAESALIFMARQ